MSILKKENELYDGQAVVNRTFGVDQVHSYSLVSWETRKLFIDINYNCISAPLSVFGMVGNIVNIIVFCKQGLKESINISLLGLAIADFFSLASTLWQSICFGPLLRTPDVPFNPLDLMYLIGGYPHAYFTRITTCITAFITLERCLCISMPLKVKTIITSLRTKIIIVSIYVIMMFIFAPFYFVNNLEWNFNGAVNKTMLTIVYGDNRVQVETATFLIHGVFLATIFLFVVIICTVILIVKLNKTSRWRQTATGGQTGSSLHEPISVKEKKVVKMVTFISTIFIICYVPTILIIFTMACEPEFSFSGNYVNIHDVVWSFAVVLETVNASVNILVYYNMSSKYKITFEEIFFDCVKRKA